MENFNLFFDQLVPCCTGRKVYLNRDKVISRISEGGKVKILDEAFTELCCLNYWNKWRHKGHARWTDSRGGNSHYTGWRREAYVKFDEICKRVRVQREDDREAESSKETQFQRFATAKYGTGQQKRYRGANSTVDDGPDVYNELDE